MKFLPRVMFSTSSHRLIRTESAIAFEKYYRSIQDEYWVPVWKGRLSDELGDEQIQNVVLLFILNDQKSGVLYSSSKFRIGWDDAQNSFRSEFHSTNAMDEDVWIKHDNIATSLVPALIAYHDLDSCLMGPIRRDGISVDLVAKEIIIHDSTDQVIMFKDSSYEDIGYNSYIHDILNQISHPLASEIRLRNASQVTMETDKILMSAWLWVLDDPEFRSQNSDESALDKPPSEKWTPCTYCRESGVVAGDQEYTSEICPECKGECGK